MPDETPAAPQSGASPTAAPARPAPTQGGDGKFATPGAGVQGRGKPTEAEAAAAERPPASTPAARQKRAYIADGKRYEEEVGDEEIAAALAARRTISTRLREINEQRRALESREGGAKQRLAAKAAADRLEALKLMGIENPSAWLDETVGLYVEEAKVAQDPALAAQRHLATQAAELERRQAELDEREQDTKVAEVARTFAPVFEQDLPAVLQEAGIPKSPRVAEALEDRILEVIESGRPLDKKALAMATADAKAEAGEFYEGLLGWSGEGPAALDAIDASLDKTLSPQALKNLAQVFRRRDVKAWKAKREAEAPGARQPTAPPKPPQNGNGAASGTQHFVDARYWQPGQSRGQ